MMRPQTRTDYAGRMLRVLVHIQQRLDEALDLDALARVAGFSPFHFHRIFRGMVGESVMQHVRRLRLERAAMRLKHTDRSVTAIAFEAGYESHEAFTRAFRGAFDCPPTEFRVASGMSVRIDAPAQVHYVAAGAELQFTPVTREDPAMKVELRTIRPMRTAFIRHVGPYQEVGQTWEKLMDWAGRACLFGPNTQVFGACWDDPEVTPPEKIRYDACITVDDSVRPEGEIGIQTLGGGRYAVALHEGPYDTLNRTYEALFGGWFASSSHEPGDPPSLEFYLNDPNSTQPEDLLTEVCMRIRD